MSNTPKKPRIIIITPFFPPNLGGVETHLSQLTNYLSTHHFPTTVLTYKPLSIKTNYYRQECHPYLNIYRFWWFGLGLFDRTTPYPPIQFLYIVPGLLLRSLIFCLQSRNKFDVIHAQGFAAAFVARIIKLFFPHRIYVVSTHFIYRRLQPTSLYAHLFKWVLAGFNTILAISHQSHQELLATGLKPNRVKVYRYWTDQKKFTPGNKQKARNLLNISSKNRLVVFFAGRLVKMKGIFTLLQVAKKVPPDLLFILAGDGPDGPKLKALSLGLDNFKLVGIVNHQQIVNYYSASDLVIIPTQAEEALSNTFIETISCGRPVVCTNKGSVSEMVHNSFGITINPTPKNIYHTLMHLYHHPKLIASLSLQAKKFARENFSVQNARVIIDSYVND
jgi:phosphatidylinositol glycan class A protein